LSQKEQDELSIADVDAIIFICPDCGMILHREGTMHRCANCRVYFVPTFNHQTRSWEVNYAPGMEGIN